MSRDGVNVTETELAILDVLWERGPTTVREIVAALYSKHSHSLHATVKSLLERLADKGYVTCDVTSYAHRFSPAVTREAFVGQQLQEIADSHFGGSIAPMLLALLDKARISRRDANALRQIISKME
jgi:predicted transcriptional regulator